jgi:hypothetical protein
MFESKLKKITKQLYPTGRGFRIPTNGIMERLHDALIVSESRMIQDALATLDVILPDNDNFTVDDAQRWEQRLGMISNSAVSLADRKAAIIRKMNHPGTILARQSHDYLQDSLRLAGFDVYVHENIPEQTIEDLLYPSSMTGQQGDGQQGDFEQGDVYTSYSSLFQIVEQGMIQQGDFQQGEFLFLNKVANHIDENIDSIFPIVGNYRSTFFVGGEVLGTFANVDANRKDEFRQLILKIKPVQTVGLLLINYV